MKKHPLDHAKRTEGMCRLTESFVIGIIQPWIGLIRMKRVGIAGKGATIGRYYLNTDPIPSYGRISKARNCVDTTGLIAFVNSKMGKPRKLLLVSRPRRFGKTYAMVMEYYAIGYDTTFLFKEKERHRKIEKVQLPQF